MEDKNYLFSKTSKLDITYLKSEIKNNSWKAFITIHSCLQHQMRLILRYGFGRDKEGKLLRDKEHGLKWNKIVEYQFADISNILFIVGIFDRKLRDKLLTYNSIRNQKIAHIDAYGHSSISDKEVEEHCEKCLELIKVLDGIYQKITFPPNRK